MTENNLSVELDESSFSEEQRLIIDVLINEGRMREREEILDMLNAEVYTIKGEDPYYEYAVKAVAEKIRNRND